ncbi:MAG: hypothetical protein M3Y82_07565 [Verrucomicrobiota bacterium]|nr:hypothetical protein [Verrucomicrobiota bacterium]
MSSVAEIKQAIDHLSAAEGAELEALLWAEWNWPLVNESADPPQLHEKLAAAAKGKFRSGNRENLGRLFKSLE